MSRRTQGLSWIAAALALFLVLVLPVCWSASMTRAWVERGEGPSSNDTNEEREEREQHEETQAVRVGSRPAVDVPVLELTVAPPVRVSTTQIVIASVAPKPHPSRFSERRLQ